MLVTKAFFLALRSIKLVNTSLEFSFFGCETGLGIFFDCIGGSGCSLSLLQLSLLGFDDLHGIVILDNGLEPRTDTQGSLSCLL